MFAGLLNKGFRGSLVLLISAYIVFAVILYISPKAIEMEHYPNLFYNFFTQYFSSKLLIITINFFFIGIGVLLLSLISVNQEVTDKQNYFPVFLFLLLSAVASNPYQITSQIITNVFILFSIYKLLDTYRKEQVLKQVFEAAFWLSFSAFITISSIISFPMFFLILFILRPFYWREWAIALTGLFMPVFFYECMAYLCNFNRWYLFEAIGFYFSSLKAPIISKYFLPLCLSLLLLLIISILNSTASGFGNTVKKQKAKIILLWYMFFSIAGIFSEGSNGEIIVLTYAFPLAFFIGDFLFGVKRLKVSNTILTVVVLGALLIFIAQLGLI